jgi:hypothetical protein
VVGGEYSHVGSHVKASSAGITNVSVPRKIFFLRSIVSQIEPREHGGEACGQMPVAA